MASINDLATAATIASSAVALQQGSPPQPAAADGGQPEPATGTAATTTVQSSPPPPPRTPTSPSIAAAAPHEGQGEGRLASEEKEAATPSPSTPPAQTGRDPSKVAATSSMTTTILAAPPHTSPRDPVTPGDRGWEVPPQPPQPMSPYSVSASAAAAAAAAAASAARARSQSRSRSRSPATVTSDRMDGVEETGPAVPVAAAAAAAVRIPVPETPPPPSEGKGKGRGERVVHEGRRTRSRPVRGAFVVFEGMDRAGKTTQTKLLQVRCVESGREVRFMRFPGELFFCFYFHFHFLEIGFSREWFWSIHEALHMLSRAHFSPFLLWLTPMVIDRSTPIGQMIDSYLKGQSEVEDHVIHLLFSANRWEAVYVFLRPPLFYLPHVNDYYYFLSLLLFSSLPSLPPRT